MLQLNIPRFQEDPYYKKTQKDLYKFGSEGLKGQFDPYYAGIGEGGGEALEDIISMGRRDITKAVTEDVARRRIGSGGRATSAIAKATADMSTKLRWQDFMRKMQGRESLLQTSLGTLSGVRGAGQTQQAQKSQFEQWRTGLEFDVTAQNQKEEAQEKARKAGLWGKILSGGLAVAGTVAGGMVAGQGGAVTGYKLGSAAGRGFSSPQMNYGQLPYSVRRGR